MQCCAPQDRKFDYDQTNRIIEDVSTRCVTPHMHVVSNAIYAFSVCVGVVLCVGCMHVCMHVCVYVCACVLRVNACVCVRLRSLSLDLVPSTE